MKIGKQTHIALLLLGALGSAGLSAQEGYSYAFKVRGGLMAGDLHDTHFDNKVISCGAEVRKEMFGEGRALSFELSWDYVPGRTLDVMRPEINGDSLKLTVPPRSFDVRREYGQGFSYKVAFNAPLKPFSWAPDDIEWFGGVSLDMYSVHTDIHYTIFHPSAPGDPAKYPGGWPDGFNNNNKYQGDSFVAQSTAITPAIFAGLRKKMASGTACELMFRNFGMRHHDFTPGIYSGSVDGKLENGTSRGWSLEFALSIKI